MGAMKDWSIDMLVGEFVCIEWRDPHNDWHWYRVLGIDLANGWICLEGQESEEGVHYDGHPIVARLDDIDLFEVLP